MYKRTLDSRVYMKHKGGLILKFETPLLLFIISKNYKSVFIFVILDDRKFFTKWK